MIAVAGGSGFIGRAVVRELLARGEGVRVMTAHPRSRASRAADGAEIVEGDVLRPETLARGLAGADAVVQALTFPTFPVQKPRRHFTFEEFDGRGTERLVAAAEAAGTTRFVYVSGAGASADAPEPWFRAKWRGERAVASSSLDGTIVRPSWVYGPGDRALNAFVAFHRRLPFVPVIGDGRQRLQPVFVDDVARVVADAAVDGGPTGEFEIGGPDVLSMDEVLETMMSVRARRKPLVHMPAALPKLAGFFLQALPRPPLSPEAVTFVTHDAVADTRSLLEAFDVRLTPLREGLETYLRP